MLYQNQRSRKPAHLLHNLLEQKCFIKTLSCITYCLNSLECERLMDIFIFVWLCLWGLPSFRPSEWVMSYIMAARLLTTTLFILDLFFLCHFCNVSLYFNGDLNGVIWDLGKLGYVLFEKFCDNNNRQRKCKLLILTAMLKWLSSKSVISNLIYWYLYYKYLYIEKLEKLYFYK